LKARQELRDRLLRAIRDAARECEHARRWEDAANLYQSAIELDSLNEGLYRGSMLCHQQLGDHSEALQAYGRCRAVTLPCVCSGGYQQVPIHFRVYLCTAHTPRSL